MDSVQDYLESEVLLTSKCLLELLRENLCPEYVRDKDTIVLTSPWNEEDYRIGVYLYDIQDYSVIIPQSVTINDKERRLPPKAAELSYLIFCNSRSRFGGLQVEPLHMMLNEIMRTVYDNPVMDRGDGETVQFSFLRESIEFKIRLWGSFNQPLCPAIYVNAAPTLISSRRIQNINRVEQRDYDIQKK